MLFCGYMNLKIISILVLLPFGRCPSNRCALGSQCLVVERTQIHPRLFVGDHIDHQAHLDSSSPTSYHGTLS